MVNKSKKKNKAKQQAAANKEKENPTNENNAASSQNTEEVSMPSPSREPPLNSATNETKEESAQSDSLRGSNADLFSDSANLSNLLDSSSRSNVSILSPFQKPPLNSTTNETKEEPTQFDSSKGSNADRLSDLINLSSPLLDSSNRSNESMQEKLSTESNAVSSEKNKIERKKMDCSQRTSQLDKSKGSTASSLNRSDKSSPRSPSTQSNVVSSQNTEEVSMPNPPREPPLNSATNETKLESAQFDCSRRSNADQFSDSANLSNQLDSSSHSNVSMSSQTQEALSSSATGGKKARRNRKKGGKKEELAQFDSSKGSNADQLSDLSNLSSPLLDSSNRSNESTQENLSPESNPVSSEKDKIRRKKWDFSQRTAQSDTSRGNTASAWDKPLGLGKSLPRSTSTESTAVSLKKDKPGRKKWDFSQRTASAWIKLFGSDKLLPRRPSTESNASSSKENQGGEQKWDGSKKTAQLDTSRGRTLDHSDESSQNRTCTEQNTETSKSEKISMRPAQKNKLNRTFSEEKEIEMAKAEWNIPKGSEFGGHEGQSRLIATNHLAIQFKNLPQFFYHYDVKFSPEKKHLKRRVVKKFCEDHCKNNNPVFDGTANLYSASELFPQKVTEKEVTLENDKKYKVTLDLVGKISTDPLQESYVKNSQPISQCLNIVLKHALYSIGYRSIDNVYVSQEARQHSLGCGMEMKLGLFQSVVFGKGSFLNVYAKQKVFAVQQKLIDAIVEVCTMSKNQLNTELKDREKKMLETFIRNLKIEYIDEEEKKVEEKEKTEEKANSRKNVYFVTELGPPVCKATFTYNENEITVEDYFKHVRGLSIQYPYMPCISVSRVPRQKRNPPTLLPPEYCTIFEKGSFKENLPDTVISNLIKLAGSAQERKIKIRELFPYMQINNHACVREFGITVNRDFEQIPSRILKAPTLIYANNEEVEPNHKAQWYSKAFHTVQNAKITWAVINLVPNKIDKTNYDDFQKKIYDGCNTVGLKIENNNKRDIIRCTMEDFNETLKKNQDLNFVLVIVVDDESIYGDVKYIAEKKVGILTQCIKMKTVIKIMNNQDKMVIFNIAQKINAKLNGTNHILKESKLLIKWPFMIMGADVTHPISKVGGTSIAAVTASFDKYAFQYNINYRFQEARQETITDLEDMTTKHLEYFKEKNFDKLPNIIVFCRDGISDGQFSITYHQEIQAVRMACKNFQKNYKPKITFLIVQKRHYIRFFPIDTNQGNQSKHPNEYHNKYQKRRDQVMNENVPVGTCVDTTITNPEVLTFYLLSHHSNLSLARPSKYVLLQDDNNMKIDDLENLTFRLCHLWSRCTKSISYPAPTYYAHLAAARIKAYRNGEVEPENDLDVSNINFTFSKAHPMFFV